MSNPICLSPLKFYDALEKQERYKSYAYGNISPVVMPLGKIYPFQFVVPNTISSITAAYIYDANTNTSVTTNIISSFREDGLSLKQVGDYKVLMFAGTLPIQEVRHEGLYYIILESSTDEKYYSEIFCFTTLTSEYLELEYWNPESDFYLKNGVVTFADNFHFKILISSELGKPEYSFEEQSTSRLGYNFIESQISKKIYKFNAILPEYICDALRLVRMCSNKKLTSNNETYDMTTFEMSVDWQEQGDLASVNCEFEVDNIIMSIGGFGYVLSGGDFNEDFNKDFKKQ